MGLRGEEEGLRRGREEGGAGLPRTRAGEQRRRRRSLRLRRRLRKKRRETRKKTYNDQGGGRDWALEEGNSGISLFLSRGVGEEIFTFY